MSGRSKVRLSDRICFGMGDFAINGIFTFVSSYLLYFYTDVAKISLSLIGIILLIGRAVDAVSSIIAGSVIDQTETRFGKCRPFIAFCMAPLGLMLLALFYVPDITSTGKAIYCTIAYIIFSIFYSWVNVPYSTLLSLVSEDNKVRIEYNVFKGVGANLSGVLVTMFTLTLVEQFGGNAGYGYTKTAFLFSVIAVASIMICIKQTKEQVKRDKIEKINLKKSMQVGKQNKYWLIFCTVMFFNMMYMIIHNQSTIYYTKYYLKREALSSYILSMTPLMCIVTAFIMPAVTKKLGMKNTMQTGNLLVSLSLVGTFLAGKNIPGVLFFSLLTSLGWSIATGMIFVIISQIIDYSDWKTGCRPQGFMTSVLTFLMKMGVAAAGFISPFILQLGGYTPDSVMNNSVIKAIHVDYIWLPLLFSCIAMIFMSMYQLDTIYPKISQKLNL